MNFPLFHNGLSEVYKRRSLTMGVSNRIPWLDAFWDSMQSPHVRTLTAMFDADDGCVRIVHTEEDCGVAYQDSYFFEMTGGTHRFVTLRADKQFKPFTNVHISALLRVDAPRKDIWLLNTKAVSYERGTVVHHHHHSDDDIFMGIEHERLKNPKKFATPFTMAAGFVKQVVDAMVKCDAGEWRVHFVPPGFADPSIPVELAEYAACHVDDDDSYDIAEVEPAVCEMIRVLRTELVGKSRADDVVPLAQGVGAVAV